MIRIHLDHLNGRPLSGSVREAAQEALELCGNPSSLHAEGKAAAGLLGKARSRVAGLIGVRSDEIVFTSGGTEANAWALAGLTQPLKSRGRHLVVSAVEHLSILQTARRMEKEGASVSVIPVDAFGRMDPARLEAALTPETVLVSIQWANPEVGTLQPIAEIACRMKARGILFHTDAVAAGGRVAMDLSAVPADALSLASGPLGGPPGAGALFIRRGTRLQPLFIGGAQEEGRRAGTENLAAVAGFGAAAEESAQDLERFRAAVPSLRDRLVRGILNRLPEASLNGDPAERLPGHVSVSFPGTDAEALILALDREGVSAGLGSACSAKAVKASHVLKAMGVADSRALGTVTLTLGLETTVEEVDRFLTFALPRALSLIGKETIRS